MTLTDGSHTATVTGAQAFSLFGSDLTSTTNGLFFNFGGTGGGFGTQEFAFEDTSGSISLHPSTISLNIPGDPSSPIWTAQSGNVEIGQAQSAIEVGTTTTNGTTLTLDDGTAIGGGTLKIDAGNTLKRSHPARTTSAPPSMASTSPISARSRSEVAESQRIDITLDDGTSITGGRLTIESGNTLTLEDASIHNTAITFAGTGDTLKLDSVRASTAPARSPVSPPVKRSIFRICIPSRTPRSATTAGPAS